jgi:hypothetical protein
MEKLVMEDVRPKEELNWQPRTFAMNIVSIGGVDEGAENIGTGVNEIDYVTKSLFSLIMSRLGRFPENDLAEIQIEYYWLLSS